MQFPVPDVPFKLGQKVHVTSLAGWQADWANVDLFIVGMTINRNGGIECHVSENWPADGGFDGVSVDDLTAA